MRSLWARARGGLGRASSDLRVRSWHTRRRLVQVRCLWRWQKREQRQRRQHSGRQPFGPRGWRPLGPSHEARAAVHSSAWQRSRWPGSCGGPWGHWPGAEAVRSVASCACFGLSQLGCPSGLQRTAALRVAQISVREPPSQRLLSICGACAVLELATSRVCEAAGCVTLYLRLSRELQLCAGAVGVRCVGEYDHWDRESSSSLARAISDRALGGRGAARRDVI